MTNEMAKAIRLVNGFKTDLRVKLNHCNAPTVKVRNFIYEHLIDLYGLSIYERLGISPNVDPVTVDFEKLEKFVERETRAVIGGGVKQ